jgi:oligoendopeptidase F
MGELAYLRYTRDLSDSYYEAEYTWCTDQTTRVEKAMEDCYTTMAKSSLRSALEEQYFGEDFFASYDSDGVYSDARTVALLQQESELQAQYVALQNDPAIEWNGSTRSVSELLENAVTADLYYEVLGAYYDAYGAQAGEIYIKLIQTRRELAGRLGYGSYADYAYDALYYRDYTPAQAERYVERVRTELAPVYTEAAEPMQLSALSADETMQHLHEAADTLGGEVQTAMGFLDAYSLYDITSSANKMPGSYTTYLESYEMPYIYISPEGTLADLLTAAHEFGHFVDGYVNCNQTFSIDCSEVFSQALEYLTLGSTSLGFARAAELRQYKLYDSLETFLTQACYYAFECKAYALPDSELTVGKLNELFAECCVDFGLFDEASAEQAARSWIDVQHFFSAPYYVISYCVSNDAALQIYQLEQETPGAGLKAFSDLLYAAPESTFLAMLQDGSLTSPFDENRMQDLAAYFKEAL